MHPDRSLAFCQAGHYTDGGKEHEWRRPRDGAAPADPSLLLRAGAGRRSPVHALRHPGREKADHLLL